MIEKKREVILESLKRLQWGKLFHMFYIEPVTMLLTFSNSLSGTILKNQVVFQACTTVFNYNESICEMLGTNNTSELTNNIETKVQPYVSNLFMVRTLLESIVPAVCGVFIGSWSDYYGRKPLLLISMIGFSFTYIISAIICQMSYYIPVNPWYYIIAVMPHSILGGYCVFQVAAFCFISDVTDKKTRPYRMIFLDICFFIAVTSGTLISSFIYSATNTTTVFSISGFLLCIATAFVALYVPETLHLKRDKDEELKKESTEKTDGSKEIEKSSDLKMIEILKGVPLTYPNEKKDRTEESEKESNKKEEKPEKRINLFSMVHIKEMFFTCLKPREYYDRSIIWLITGVLFISIFIFDGAITVVYLYLREKFHWTVREITVFEAVFHSVPMVGALTGFLILRKFFGVSVVSLALLSFFSDIISSIVRGLASEPWHLYLSVGLGAFRTVSSPMCRTIVSNIVPQNELGKIFSIKNILQSLAPFLAAPLYTFIYQKSLTTFPGLFFIVSAFLYGIAFLLMLVVLVFKYKFRDHYAQLLK